MAIDFVMADQPWAPPGAAAKVHAISRREVALESHLAMYAGIAGDRGNTVASVAAEPSLLAIEDAGSTGGTRWFRLSRPRAERITVKAKDARGATVASFDLRAIDVPRGPGRVDGAIDPSKPGTVSVRVYDPKDDADYVDKRMIGIGYNIYLRGLQIHCAGMSTPIHVPNALIDLTLAAAEPIDNTVYDTLAQAIAAIQKAAARAGATRKSVRRFAYYRGAGGAVIAPTVFSPATSPRIIATYYEARRLYANDAVQALIGIAISIGLGTILRVAIGRFMRKISDDPEPPPRALPAPAPARIRPVNGTVNVGGGSEIANATNLNPVNPNSGGQSRGIPNHIQAPMEQMGEIFVPGSVQTMYGNRLRYADIDWPVATRAAASVMPSGGRVSMNIHTSDRQEVDALVSAFQQAGFRVTEPGGPHAPGWGTLIQATRL